MIHFMATLLFIPAEKWQSASSSIVVVVVVVVAAVTAVTVVPQ